MTAAVDIILDRHENVTVLPAEALRPGDKVMVVTGKGKDTVKTERSVKIGLKNYGDAEIIDGLKPGDKVEVPKIVAKDRRKINVGGPDDNKDDNNSSDDSGNKDSGDSSGDKKD
jgi:multidrug efflux pump subunit AcrA (membrane-fusion protein)